MQEANRPGKQQGVSFREFSRLRYKELAEEAKELDEQDIVAKIIGEWNILQNGNNLQKQKHPSTPDKLNLQIEGSKGKSHVKTTAHKTELREQAIIENKNVSSFELYAQQSIRKVGKRSRKLRDYITFYRFHSKRLAEAHSTWTSNQIAIIIKLLWRKEKIAPKRKLPLRKKTQIRMAGRTIFRIYKRKEGLNTPTINQLWKRLPFESKLAWERFGNPRHKVRSQDNCTISISSATKLKQLLGL